jgi:predicted nuclease of predicted toxin-antitoxin system
MRFLVDASTGRAVVDFLRAEGHDVLAVVEWQPNADDAAILERAHGEDRVVVTNDKDFGDLAFRGGRAHRGVLLLRLNDESAANRVRVVARVVGGWGSVLPGSFVVATDDGVRVRPRQET